MPLVSKKNTVDAWVGARLPAFQATQEAWKAAKGQYFQGLVTHMTLPTNDGTAPPDNLSAHPTDNPALWNDFLTFGSPPIVIPPAMPAALIFNVYESPLGWGWECRSEFIYGTKKYSKVWNTGPETFRNTDWIESAV